MHELLIERGRIIDQLIEIKTRQGGGSAFRPAREASMMRAIAERHRGRLPLDTVESIWRVIISTFTYIQAPYSVHVDVSRDDAGMRDSARFHFGFTVPCVAALRRGGCDPGGRRVGRRSRHVCARWRPGGRRVVDGTCAAGRAQDHRPAAVRGARRSPSRHAGVRDLETAGRRSRPRGGARVCDARPLARRRSPGIARNRRRSGRLRRQRDGACPAGGAAGEYRARTR